MLEIEDEKFEQTRKKAEKEYQKIGQLYCPYLAKCVHFNNRGFEHLLFKEWNKTRTRPEQYTRLRLLPLASEIIKKSHTLQEFDDRRMFVRQKINSRWESRVKNVKYYAFVAMIKSVRIKIIIKEIDGSVPIFYSLYPSWRVEKMENGEKKKIFYSGNLELD